MKGVKPFSLFVLIGLLPNILFSQIISDSFDCYMDSIKSDENVFKKIQADATFKGGSSAFKTFLIQNINHSKFITQLSLNSPLYNDTAKVKFIISKKGVMSNLQISETGKDSFKTEIEKVLKKSSCFWEPGDNSGRLVNGWYQCDLFYLIELKSGELNIRVSFKWYDFVGKQ